MATSTLDTTVMLDNTADDPTRRAPLVLNHTEFGFVTDTVCGVVERKTPKMWYPAFAIAVTLTGVLFAMVTYLVTTGGYPENHISVVRGDGSGEVVWRNELRVYVPSMVVHEGHFYGVSDAGQAYCHAIDNSTPTWEERVRGKFAASLTLVGDLIYATSDKGKTFIYKANPEAFELVAENKVTAIDIQATPTICGGRIYMRIAQKQGDNRQEMLYCIGAE